jgi:hypothetical protein
MPTETPDSINTWSLAYLCRRLVPCHRQYSKFTPLQRPETATESDAVPAAIENAGRSQGRVGSRIPMPVPVVRGPTGSVMGRRPPALS